MAARLTRRTIAALALLALALTLVHLWLVGTVFEPQIGAGAADRMPRRIEVAFVRELQQTTPPPAAAAPPPRRAPPPLRTAAAAPAAAPAASAPPPPEPVASEPERTVADAAAALVASEPAEPEAAAASAATAAASAPAAFEWPPSTRLTYTLSGNYRGPVEGQAQVEWLTTGSRYQVNLDISVGPSFAPLLARRLTSDGEITEQGLVPKRYDEETRAVLRETRSNSVRFDGAQVLLANGRSVPQPPGVQDSASQFVQLTWLFTTRPELLTPGRSVEIPLALPRRLEPWTYDVLERVSLMTPAGTVDTVHVKPRREPRPGSELTAELWVAPSLQYLPVRIVIRQDADTYADLLISRLPQQAGR